MSKVTQLFNSQRQRLVSVFVVLAVLGGVAVSVISAQSAHADYFTGCNYGYGSDGTSFGQGAGYGYGYLANHTNFAYGYGNQICPMAITTSSPLPGGWVGQSYSLQFGGSGGWAPYTWSETGALPNGITLSSSGLFSGYPTTAGTYSFLVTMTDVNAQTTSANFSVTIGSSNTLAPAPPTTVTIAPSTTTTVAPPPPAPHARLIYVNQVGLATSKSVSLRYHCVAARCVASAIVKDRLNGRLVWLAWARFTMAKNSVRVIVLRDTAMGAKVFSTHGVHGTILITTVGGGGRTQRTIVLKS